MEAVVLAFEHMKETFVLAPPARDRNPMQALEQPLGRLIKIETDSRILMLRAKGAAQGGTAKYRARGKTAQTQADEIPELVPMWYISYFVD